MIKNKPLINLSYDIVRPNDLEYMFHSGNIRRRVVSEEII